MNPNLKLEEAIELAKKALKDIGHWEPFKLERARFLKKNEYETYDSWLVSFNFTEKDWHNGEITPVLTINDEELKVIFVSWKKSEFLLSYNEKEDKYFHPKLSREQEIF